MTKIRSMLVDQSIMGGPERRGDERSEAPRSGGSPIIEPDAVPVPPDSEVPARHARRRFTTGLQAGDPPAGGRLYTVRRTRGTPAKGGAVFLTRRHVARRCCMNRN